MLSVYRERYDVAVGLSDHSGTIYPGLAAAVLGGEVLEVHVTLSREMYGPDVAASVTTAELRQLVTGVRAIEIMKAAPMDKDLVSKQLAPVRDLFMKSVVCRQKLPKGTVLKAEHLAAKKPGTGIPASRLSSFIGLRTTRALDSDELLREGDVEPGGAE
jgi:N-acetylneuraminate synthase